MPQTRQLSAELLTAEAIAIRDLGATVISSTDIGAHAIEYAVNNWAVGPLCKRDRKTGKIVARHGKDPVGYLVPHGVLDFTSDVDTVIRWFSQGPWNIGTRVPESMFVLDADDLDALAALEAEHGKRPTHSPRFRAAPPEAVTITSEDQQGTSLTDGSPKASRSKPAPAMWCNHHRFTPTQPSDTPVSTARSLRHRPGWWSYSDLSRRRRHDHRDRAGISSPCPAALRSVTSSR
jgi:hypothetical protein